MPSKHQRSDSISRSLCDQLLSLLQSKYAGLRRHEAENCCSAFIGKQPRLYYVYHEQNRISVWPRWAFGDAEDLRLRASAAGLTTGLRKKIDSSWAHNYPLNIYVHTEPDLRQLLPIIEASERMMLGDPEPDVSVPDTLAHEIPFSGVFPEGAKKEVTINAYERSSAARAACIAHYGLSCVVCGFDFEEIYGDLGRGFIHVHHIVPISSIGVDYEVNPIEDLRPVCPNCHEMLHRGQPPLSIEDLRLATRSADLEKE